MPTKILGQRFNDLQDRIAAIMGTATDAAPTSGYGQTFSSANVIPYPDVNDLDAADKISALQYQNLYTDMIRARVHQIGGAYSIDPFVVGDYATNTTSTDKVQETYIATLESLMTQIEADKFEIDLATQASIESLRDAANNLIQSTRLQSTFGPWNGQLTHIFDVEFDSVADRRHFFNAGGSIRFNASIDYTGSQTKTVTWKNTLSTMGTVIFKANETVSLSTGTTRAVGNYQIGPSYTLAFQQSIGGVYSGSYYEIHAFNLNTTTIRMRARFRDSDPESFPKIDEDVFGDISSTIQVTRPDGQVTIDAAVSDTVVVNSSLVGTTQSTL